jgi:hypothetical protein
VQNAEFGISHHSMDNQAPKKEYFMKSGIAAKIHPLESLQLFDSAFLPSDTLKISG